MPDSASPDLTSQREHMVEAHIAARGVRDPLVLQAMRAVRREAFVPEEYRELTYEDSPLPIGEDQTISQPYIVAFMAEALGLKGGEKVLEVGSGSGYAAAVLGQIAGQVFAIERHGTLAARSRESLAALGIGNVHIRHADGTEGWPDEAPFDAILVSAGAPAVPPGLQRQLRVGGRMVIPVGRDPRAQELIRITREGQEDFTREDIADVRFVPLVGREGWEQDEPEFDAAPQGRHRIVQARPRTDAGLPGLIAAEADEFADAERADFDAILRRIGESRLVLIGEATHGTHEFYRLRARLTEALIQKKGFNFVAVEADWPDAARIDHYVRHRDAPSSGWTTFARFPTWMWRNEEVRSFVDWLHAYNLTLAHSRRAGFHGLDLYAMHNSAARVLEYLEKHDPESAAVARLRYACLSPWESDPAAYGHAALTGAYKECEKEVVGVLVDLMRERAAQLERDGDSLFDAQQNALLVTNAERYYRVMYYGSRASWNLRDQHMFDTLQRLLAHYGEGSKGVVWAHNSHLGDARATEMSARGETNLGALCREAFGDDVYIVGFGTDHGTVAAASEWDGPMEIKPVNPSHPQSYERQFHLSGEANLFLPLRGAGSDLRRRLSQPLLERAIGVIYRPESERFSHYFEATLPRQFDEYIWFDKTRAVTPIGTRTLEGVPDTYPFGV